MTEVADSERVDKRDVIRAAAFWNKISAGMFAILAAAFAWWAAVVWEGVQVAESALGRMTVKIEVAQERYQAIDRRLTDIERRIMTHLERPWHNKAGNELSAIRQELISIRREMGYHKDP